MVLLEDGDDGKSLRKVAGKVHRRIARLEVPEQNRSGALELIPDKAEVDKKEPHGEARVRVSSRQASERLQNERNFPVILPSFAMSIAMG